MSEDDKNENALTNRVDMTFQMVESGDETEVQWLQRHKPGDPILIGLGNVGFTFCTYQGPEKEFVGVGMTLRQIPPDLAEAGDMMSNEDYNSVVKTAPILQEFRFINRAGATVISNSFRAVVNVFDDQEGEGGELTDAEALLEAARHLVAEYGTGLDEDCDEDECVGWTGDGMGADGEERHKDIPFTFGQVRRLARIIERRGS